MTEALNPAAESVPLPPTALLGEEAVAKVAEEVASLVRSRHDPHIVNRATETARALLEAGGTGEPALKFGSHKVEGGYLRTPVHVRPNLYNSTTWEMAAVVDGTGHTTGVRQAELRWPVEGLFIKERNLDPTPLVIGQEAIRARLAAHRLGILEGTETFQQDSKFLAELARTKLPFAEFYPMDPEDRARLAGILRRRILVTPETDERKMALEALVYCQGLDSDGRLELLQSIGEDLTLLLPVRPGEGDMTPIVAAELLSIDYEPDPDLLRGAKATPEIRHAAFVSKLYADLSRALDDGRPAKPPLARRIEVADPPAPRDLAIFGGPIPLGKDIRADIQYLRAWQAAGYSIDHVIELVPERDEEMVKMGVARIIKHVLASNDPVERAEAFLALEYLYNLQRDIQRDYMYELFTLRFALTVPFKEPASLRGYVGAAQTMGDVMPTPPANDRGESLPQPARTAAMMSRIYDARVRQLVFRIKEAARRALQNSLFPEEEETN